jgi:hypothetical protein
MIKNTLDSFKQMVFKTAVYKKIMTMVGEQSYIVPNMQGDSELGLGGPTQLSERLMSM